MIQLIVLLPLAAALVAGFGNRMLGNFACKLITTSALFASAILSWPIFIAFLAGSQDAYTAPMLDWIRSGDLVVNWSLQVDALTAVMLVVVTTVSALVHLYSWGYMAEDDSQPRFFAYLSLFTFAMLMLVTAAALVILALRLLGRRDVGLGMFPARLGDARGSLRSPLALAAHLHRGTAIGWILALAVFGAVIGAIVDSAQNLFGDNARMAEIVRQIGGPGAISNALLAGLGGMAGILATIAAVSAAGRMVTEEQSERSSLILSAGVGRTRWQAGHLLFVAAVPVLMLAAAGVTAGILHGARSGDFGTGFTDALTAMLAQLPAVWVVAAVAVLLQGWAPQLWPVAWVVLVVAVLIGQLGPVLQLPQFVQDVSPFTHLGSVLTSGVPWGAVAVLIALTAVLTGAAVAGFRRRDLT